MSLKKTRTMCTTCHARCGVYVYSDEDNRIVKIEGNADCPKSQGTVCGAGLSQREVHNNLDGRILYPMKRVDWDPAGERNPQNRGKSEFERISWDEALDILAGECKRISTQYGPDAIITGQGTGRTTNHWHCRLNSTLGLQTWSLVPTHVCLMPHIIPFAYTMGQTAGGAGDIMNAKTIVLWGQNPSMERAFAKVIYGKQAADPEFRLVVVDVRFHDMAKHADLAIQPRPGTDGALAMAVMHEIIENHWYDDEWISKWTYGFEELAERVKDWTPEKAAEICWITPEEIRAFAQILAQHAPVSMCIGLGPGCMHTNAIQNGRAVACLYGILGSIDVEGGMQFPQAIDVMLDDKITLWDSKKNPMENWTFGGDEHPLYKAFGRSNDPYTVFNAILTGEPRPVKAFIAIANDPLLCYENANLTYKAMTSENLEFIASKDFYMSPTTKLSDLIFPSADWSERCTYDEELDRNMIYTFDKAVDPPGECWDDWKFFLEWGRRLNPELWPWKDEKEMVLWRLKEFYSFDLTWDEFQSEPFRSTEPEVQKGGEVEQKRYEKGLLRADGKPGFNTPTGRVELKCDALAMFGYDPLPDYTEPFESPYSTPELAKEYPLIAVTGIRVYSFFHSAWTNIPAQRKLYPDPFIVIHPDDAREFQITDGEWVTVSSPRGKMISKALVSRETKKGVICVPRAGWRDECKELGLPGMGWDKANGNVLVPSVPSEPGYGATAMRSSLCKIEAGRGDL